MPGNEMSDTGEFLDQEALCLSCGLCCDGTLFSLVPIRDCDDITVLQASVQLLPDGQSGFEQPCRAYSNRGCRIYADRPTNCRKFHCKLLDELRERKIALPEAREKIKRVFAFRNDFRETLRRLDPASLATPLPALWAKWNGDGLAFRQKHGAALMQLAALNWYLQRNFRKDKIEEQKA